MWDGCRGWAQSRWILTRTYGPPYASGHAVAVVKSLFSDVLSAPGKSAGIVTKGVITTEMEVAEAGDEWVAVALPDGREGYVPHSDVKLVDRTASLVIWPPSGEKLVATARRLIGVPYLWGGTTPFGLDCSGFVQLVYHILGVALPRDSRMQAEDDRAVPIEREELRAGDLVFFASCDDDRRITHVGMAIGAGQFIHSSSGAGVMITSLNEPRYAEMYWGARRLRCETWESGSPGEA